MEDSYSLQIRFAVLCYGDYGYYPVALFSAFSNAKDYYDSLVKNSRYVHYNGKYKLVKVLDYKTPLLGNLLNIFTE